MEEILKMVEKVSKHDSEHSKQVSLLYKRISELKITESNEYGYIREYILPKINDLCKRDVIKKDILYLSLIGNHNFKLLEKLLKYTENSLEVSLDNPTKLYDYCVFKKSHWFLELLSSDSICIPNRKIFNKILTLQLINLTNFHDFDVDHIKNLLTDIDKEDIQPFWINYFKIIEYSVKIIEYIKQNVCLLNVQEVFSFFQEHSALETCSNYLDLKNTLLTEIYDLIKEEEEIFQIFNVQCSQFEAFAILKNLFDCITKTPNLNISETVKDLKEKLLNIPDSALQLELLENVFATLFTESSHLSSNKDECTFICEEKEIRLIVYLVKEILEEIKMKNIPPKQSPEYLKFNQLHKVVADAIWRMELIRNVKNNVKCEKYLLKYMLSTPESLIQMCVKKNDFERAFQVIKIFSIEDPHLISELQFTEDLINLRENLKKTFKIKAIQKINPKMSVANFDLAVDKTVEQFFKRNIIEADPDITARLNKLSEKYNFFKHFSPENEIFMNMLDLAITLPQNFENSEIILQLAYENNCLDTNISSNYGKFCKKLTDLYKEIGKEKNVSVGDMLTSPQHQTDLKKHIKQEEFYHALSLTFNEAMTDLNISEPGILINTHPSHKTILKINNLIVKNSESNSEIKYISKLYNYLKAFSHILYIEQNTSDIVSNGKTTSYFDLLTYNRSELMGKLLFERHLDPSEFEKYFGKLKLDYLYHVVGNCFPTINLTQENVTKDELYPENNLYVPNKSVITYIQKRNWLLAYILNKMYTVEDVRIEISEIRIRVFINYLALKKIDRLKIIYDDNVIVTALQNEINFQKIYDLINASVLKHEKLLNSHLSQTSNDSLETGQEPLEDSLYINWKELLDLVRCVPEEQVKENRACLNMIDMVLVSLITDGMESEYYRYILFIDDRGMRINVILNHMKVWPGDFCLDVIKSELTRFDGEQDGTLAELRMWLFQIALCEKLKFTMDLTSWYAAYKMCEGDKEHVISKLVESADINLMLDFIDLHTPNETFLEMVDENFFFRIFESPALFNKIKLLLDILPFKHGIRICYRLIKLLKRLEDLKFVVEYLLNNVNDDTVKNVEISLKMLSVFPQNEQDQLLCLLYDPLSIIEILIMNTKLDKLSSVLEVLKVELSQTEYSEEVISLEKIDEVLRKYAEKSLDFRIITQPIPRLLITPDIKLMQSLDTLNLPSDGKYFVMPVEVPSRDEWVPNNEVLECMCCQTSVFSMFNRRHHCRRCGRVVCYSCSQNRMLVPTYDDILVRVCKSCYVQTMGESETSEFSDTISTNTAVYDYWYLTDDPVRNKIVREDFSYEHAPSVSLCLSLMKFHSKTVEYPKFLLEQCNLMLKLIQPNQEPIQEIDYMLVIKMLKTLAMAAKMSSIECYLQYGTSLADRILSQTDLLSLLAERGCLNLLPNSCTYSQGPYIDASVLRRLRDRLLEREQWNLALEVSTKAGLENTGVFAIWGKSCLKAGNLTVAREKFQRCLDKTAHYENLSEFSMLSDSSENLSRSRKVSRTSNLSNLSETKPTKNPPLLNDIIHILEANTREIDPSIIKLKANEPVSSFNTNQSLTNSQSDSAICIMNKLKNLKNISSKIYYQSVQTETKPHSARPPMCRLFYDECIYYLTRYGTHVSLLEFYVKHGDINLALNYIIDNRLATDIFIEIYMKCLKDGLVGILQEKMSSIDSTLDIWKDYLRIICRHLEQHNMLHSLYQLQQFMGDFIRAAMTCIRFYQENVLNFKDLSNNAQFLFKAKDHLRYVDEQKEWVEVATVSSSASQTSFEEKGITNPSLVMKISSKDVNKHIKTIGTQIEITEFLTRCEEELERKPVQIYIDLEKPPEDGTSIASGIKPKIPTLFGSTWDKIDLAVLAIVCGKKVEDGFNIAIKIIQDFTLKPVKIFCAAGKQLAKEERYSGIAQLVNCIKQSGTNDGAVIDMCDEMLNLAVATFTKANVTGTKVEDLIKLISNKTIKISAYIEAKQLKTAYFLAVKYKRMSDIRRILREAELLNQPSIKALCLKVLQSHSHAPAHSTKES